MNTYDIQHVQQLKLIESSNPEGIHIYSHVTVYY